MPRRSIKKTASTPATRRAFGYVRVSTSKQADEGVSLEAQRAQIEAACAANGWTLAAVFIEEGVSGSVPFRQRPQGAALWASLAAGDVLIATKLDRAFRDDLDARQTLAACDAANVGLVLVDLGTAPIAENPTARLVFGMMGNIAQFERARIAERISDAKAYQRSRGEYLGGSVPFGFRLTEQDGDRFVERDEALCGIVRTYAARGLASRAIANFLKVDHGIITTHKSVCKLLSGLSV